MTNERIAKVNLITWIAAVVIVAAMMMIYAYATRLESSIHVISRDEYAAHAFRSYRIVSPELSDIKLPEVA